jgi:hypothetical protein
MADNARLLLVEAVLPAVGESPSDGEFNGELFDVTMPDLHMLVMHAARERTEAEYRALLEAAGFRLTTISATQSLRSLIESVPTRSSRHG